eukprot:SAG11_NODE_921_length_6541_cov_9.172462_6_plen_87_part_00
MNAIALETQRVQAEKEVQMKLAEEERAAVEAKTAASAQMDATQGEAEIEACCDISGVHVSLGGCVLQPWGEPAPILAIQSDCHCCT